MSTSKRLRARATDQGFTLVEVLVAMGLTAVILVAALPALLSMLSSTQTVRRDTRAKNLTQERVEQMRDLRYHIDRQNGPFLDLLDIYYTNATSTGVPTTISAGGNTLVGSYVATAAASNGEPAAPFYRSTISSVAGAANYSQVIDAQFLAPDGTVVPATRFQDVYDSQTVGRDQAPSLMLGVTILTKWTDGTRAKVLRTYTRITENRSAVPVIQTQARAVALDVTSTGADGATLELKEGTADADGAQSSGSTVAGRASGAVATRNGVPAVTGLQAQFSLPTTPLSTTGSSTAQSGSACSWYGFGRTGVSDAGGDVSTGLPKAPADADAATPPNSMSGYVGDNSGGSCGLLSFDNLAGGGTALAAGSALASEMGAAPYVRIADTGSGSAAAVSGSAYVYSNALTSVPQKSVSGAASFVKREVVLFPNTVEPSGGHGLVSLTLNSASVACGSGSSTANGSVAAAYSLTLGWWGRAATETSASWKTATWTYDSTAGAAPVLQSGSATWSPTTTYLSNGLRLSDVVSSSIGTAPSVVNAGATTGLRGFTNGVVSMTTASTLSNEAGPGYSAIKLVLGQLTCVADDQR